LSVHKPDRITSVLETIDVESGERTRLASFDDRIEAPNWTSDGQRLIVNRRGHMYAFDIARGTLTAISTSFVSRCNNDHALSPDNQLLAVSHHTAEDGKSRIYVLPLAGGHPVLVTPIGPSYLHGWSPDGQHLVYCGERQGQYDIYRIPHLGGVEVKLTDTPGLDDGPEYAPDGRHIWFNSVRTGLMQIWRMDPDGANPTQMTFSDANNWFPHVSPDGALVAFLSYQKGDVNPDEHPPNKLVSLHVMTSDGGEVRTATTLLGGQGTLNVNSWAPDSRRFAFVSYLLPD
jgi:dipeptidyl aminopeptidase/acylaminoacyl peptidase